MMIPSEMPSVTMGENGHGNGNNHRVTVINIMVEMIMVAIMMEIIMEIMIIMKGLSSMLMRSICEGG